VTGYCRGAQDKVPKASRWWVGVERGYSLLIRIGYLGPLRSIMSSPSEIQGRTPAKNEFGTF